MACETLAKVLKRSVGRDAPPITSFQLRYPLIIHAESKTHRLLSENEVEPETPGLMNDRNLSRNARSSRAVPTTRLIEEVKTNPYVPRYWGANQKGMQAGAECDELVDTLDFGGFELMSNERAWLVARDNAVGAAQAFADAGYHKQIANRLLAPFLHIDTVVTATEWDNFFLLRDHDAAEPHIRDLARAMKVAIAEWDDEHGGPTLIEPGDWHTPYAHDAETYGAIVDYLADMGMPHRQKEIIGIRREVSVTRCAQVSYTPFHEAKLTIEQEVARHDALVAAQPMHASPCEHQARPDRIIGRDADGDPIWEFPKLHGNLTGWIQYRKTVPGERA